MTMSCRLAKENTMWPFKKKESGKPVLKKELPRWPAQSGSVNRSEQRQSDDSLTTAAIIYTSYSSSDCGSSSDSGGSCGGGD